MGGDEVSLPTANFRPAFDLARSEGLHIVCHAGEIGGPDYVREAVELLGAERIGHGIAIMNDPALADSLAMRRIVLENCPTSNLCTGALAKQLSKSEASFTDHPLPKFLDRGLAVTLSTDDPALFHTDLLTEYSRAASLGLSDKQLLQLAEQSFNAAFLPPLDKRKLYDDFRAAAKSAGLL
jgi:aminodeoxyfutalosine deaminase